MPRVGHLLAAIALGLAADASRAAPVEAGWARAERLVDAPLAGARDVTSAAVAESAVVPLPTPVIVAGRSHASVRVGIGTLVFPAATARLEPHGSPPSDDGDELRLDVLAGDGVVLGPRGRVLVSSGASGVAIRWTELVLADGGTATAEVLTDVTGSLLVQYLRVPDRVAAHASPGLHPATATAFRLEAATLPRAPSPESSSSPPPSCAPRAGTWCDEADGPGTLRFWLDEDFDDGGAAGRGWANAGNNRDIWHEVAWATCAPGASSNPGRAWYAGDDASCSYPARRADSLLSPVVGPLTAGARLTFLSRLAKSEPDDRAEVLVNGNLVASYVSPADPDAWYVAAPLDLSAFAGQSVRVEFRFTSDNSYQDLGWFVDDVKLYDAASANVACRANAGLNGDTPCSQRVAPRWDFDEGGYCQGCTYSFYVLVECGREMHLPLDDMEGADVSITNVVTGAPVSLHCVNQTARAQAGLGTYPYIPPLTQECCAGSPGVERWYGPPFDETDTAGQGHVAWGLPTCTSVFDALDSNGDGAIGCSELGTCGGEIPGISPGEYQVMDCSITDDSGLCGLYRVDVTSGGYVWSLFANCDGTSTPQFPIYFDCTDAWAAYDPLPELAVANVSASGSCPSVAVSFDLVNLGCRDHPGPTTVRIVSDCVPADSRDYVVPDAVPANGRVAVTGLPFTSSCMPVRLEVRVDPDDAVAECTESPSAAACRAVAGRDSLATFACGCGTSLLPDAGSDVALCPGEPLLLDGSRSIVAPCVRPLYRWLDAAGAVACDWSDSPTCAPGPVACPGATFTLEVACSGETCTARDDVSATCLVPIADAGTDVVACASSRVVLSGAASSIAGCSQALYRWTDPAGLVASSWNVDPTVDLGPLDASEEGTWHLDVTCSAGGTCMAGDDVEVEAVGVIAEAGPDLVACEGTPLAITGAGAAARNCSTVVHEWLDEWGDVLAGPLPDPAVTITGLAGCPLDVTLTLRSTCDDAGRPACSSTDVMTIHCEASPAAPSPSAQAACPGRPTLLGCGEPAGSSGTTWTWDFDVAVDSDGDTIGDDDVDASGCDASVIPPEGDYVARVVGHGTTGCSVSADVGFTVASDAVPAEVLGDRVTRSGPAIELTWSPVAGVTSYRVARGTLPALWRSRAYDHASDDGAGQGACDAGNLLTWTDPDDAMLPGAFYYLVTAVSACGSEGPAGEGWDGRSAFARSARASTGSCP